MGKNRMKTTNGGHTTTEELIVSYLDGELVRKELEAVLFDRLAKSPEARLLMREYLEIRGAIRSSMSDPRFQLSPALDARTRSRIETMLVEVPTLETGTLRLKSDKPAIATVATGRSLKLWTKRLVPTLALLLLAVGTTWYVTRTATEKSDLATNTVTPSSSVSVPATTPASNVNGSSTSAQTLVPNTAPERVRIVKEYISVPAPVSQNTAENLQQSAPVTEQQTTTPAVERADPKDIMISHRFGKLIRATNAVQVTQQDRL